MRGLLAQNPQVRISSRQWRRDPAADPAAVHRRQGTHRRPGRHRMRFRAVHGIGALGDSRRVVLSRRTGRARRSTTCPTGVDRGAAAGARAAARPLLRGAVFRSIHPTMSRPFHPYHRCSLSNISEIRDMTKRSSVVPKPGPTITGRQAASTRRSPRSSDCCSLRNGWPLRPADALLDQIAETSDQPATLARVYGQRAHAAVLRYDYTEGLERLTTAGTAGNWPDGASNWTRTASKPTHGEPQPCAPTARNGVRGIGTTSIDPGSAANALRSDESYAGALAHQVLADCYRLSMPRLWVYSTARGSKHLCAPASWPPMPRGETALAELYSACASRS